MVVPLEDEFVLVEIPDLKMMAISIIGREMEWCEMTCDDQISNKHCKCMQIVVSI
jgi:hypothetical protein